MNIGIDANYLIFEQAGIGKYTKNIIRNLLNLPAGKAGINRKNQYFLYFSYLRHTQKRRREIDDFLSGIKSKKVNVRIFPLPAAWYEFITASIIPPFWLYRDRLDIFFAPYVASVPRNMYWPKNLPRGKAGQKPPKVVTTIHDLVFLRFPEHRGKKLSQYYLKRHKIACRNSQKLIAVSQATKNDLMNLLAVDDSKVQVIYEAAAKEFHPLVKRERKKADQIISRYFNPETKYILSVGTLEPRKNLVRLISAYSLLPYKLKQQYQLVLVGGSGWNNKILRQTIDNLNLKDKVILPGFVLDEDLPYIYNKASIFVYPSLYEGFGLPPLEAMASGAPVIASNISSLPEVLGHAGLLVNSEKEEEIARAIQKILVQPKLAEKLSKQGLLQAKKFSWAKTAQETLEVFKTII